MEIKKQHEEIKLGGEDLNEILRTIGNAEITEEVYIRLISNIETQISLTLFTEKEVGETTERSINSN